jgi:Animal haem peroxidase
MVVLYAMHAPQHTTTVSCDCSIYGRSNETAALLRGEGALMNLTADGLPHSVIGADGVSREWLIADQRSAQHPGTLALHTLLLREHNRRVAEFTPEYLQQLEAQYGCQPKPCTQVVSLHFREISSKVH